MTTGRSVRAFARRGVRAATGGAPRPALFLGLGGLIPFLYGALASLWPELTISYFAGRDILSVYGALILSFMGGALWGFAARAGRATWVWLGLSVLPTILVFFALILRPSEAVGSLMILFPSLLAADFAFQRAGLTPRWWMKLRCLLTFVVMLCLLAGLGERSVE